MSDDAIVYLGYTVNTVALCSLGCCYGHRVLRSWHARDEPQVLAHVVGCGFANVGITLDPSHFSFMPNEITQLARDVADALRKDGRPAVSSEETLDEFVQEVLDKVEAVGGFDLTTYEVDDDEDDDDEDDEFTDEELDDRWDDDDDEDDEPDTL